MRKIFYFIPVILFASWGSFLYIRSMQAPTVTLPVRGYDPVSPFSGHYITYRIDWDNVDCSTFPDKKCPNKICKWGGNDCRFYIPEKVSKKLDHDFRFYCSNKIKCEIEFSFVNEESLIPKKLLMDGKDWKEYLNSTNPTESK